MKLPDGLFPDYARQQLPDVDALCEAIVRDCAKVCKRIAVTRFVGHGYTESDTGASYYHQKNTQEEYETRDEEDEDCANAILSRYGLKGE